MQKRFGKEELTLEKLQEVRSKYNKQMKEKSTNIELTLEEEDLLMLGENGISTLSIPETEKEIELLNAEIVRGLDLIEDELSKLNIKPKKVNLLNDNDEVVEELEVMDFAEIDPKVLSEVRIKASQRHTTGTTTGHVSIGATPTSAHYYDGVKCVHSQLGYMTHVKSGYVPVWRNSTTKSKSDIIARVYPKESFTYLTSASSNGRTKIQIQDSAGKFSTGYIENKFSISEIINSQGNFSGGSALAIASMWVGKTWGWVKKTGESKQPLFKNFYSTNGGLPIYDGGKNQIGKRAGYGCYVSGRVGAKTGDSMKNWLQIQFYQTSTASSPQGNNTFHSAGISHPYFVSTGIDSNSSAPFVRIFA